MGMTSSRLTAIAVCLAALAPSGVNACYGGEPCKMGNPTMCRLIRATDNAESVSSHRLMTSEPYLNTQSHHRRLKGENCQNNNCPYGNGKKVCCTSDCDECVKAEAEATAARAKKRTDYMMELNRIITQFTEDFPEPEVNKQVRAASIACIKKSGKVLSQTQETFTHDMAQKLVDALKKLNKNGEIHVDKLIKKLGIHDYSHFPRYVQKLTDLQKYLGQSSMAMMGDADDAINAQFRAAYAKDNRIEKEESMELFKKLATRKNVGAATKIFQKASGLGMIKKLVTRLDG